MKYFLKKVDAYIDRFMAAYNYPSLERAIQYVGMGALVVLISLCTLHFVMRSPQWRVSVVQSDLHRIAKALRALDRDCFICDMRVGLHPVQILTRTHANQNSMYIRLKNPEKWRGAYLEHVPTLQSKPYQLLKTNKSLFIVPGEGVTLPSGLTIGTDVEWHADTDVASLAAAGGPLFYKSGPVALEVLYGERAREESTGLLPHAARQLSAWMAEFNQAMSFASAQDSHVELRA